MYRPVERFNVNIKPLPPVTVPVMGESNGWLRPLAGIALALIAFGLTFQRATIEALLVTDAVTLSQGLPALFADCALVALAFMAATLVLPPQPWRFPAAALAALAIFLLGSSLAPPPRLDAMPSETTISSIEPGAGPSAGLTAEPHIARPGLRAWLGSWLMPARPQAPAPRWPLIYHRDADGRFVAAVRIGHADLALYIDPDRAQSQLNPLDFIATGLADLEQGGMVDLPAIRLGPYVLRDVAMPIGADIAAPSVIGRDVIDRFGAVEERAEILRIAVGETN